MPIWWQEGPAVQQWAGNSSKPTRVWGSGGWLPPTQGEVCTWWGLHSAVPGARSGNLKPLEHFLAQAYLAQLSHTGMKAMQTPGGGRSKPALRAAGCHPATEPQDACGAPATFPRERLLRQGLQDWRPVPPIQMLFLQGQDVAVSDLDVVFLYHSLQAHH